MCQALTPVTKIPLWSSGVIGEADLDCIDYSRGVDPLRQRNEVPESAVGRQWSRGEPEC